MRHLWLILVANVLLRRVVLLYDNESMPFVQPMGLFLVEMKTREQVY